VKEVGGVKLMRVLSLAIGAALLTGAAPSGDLDGVWRNAHNTIHLRLAPCGPAYCATVVWATETARADARKGSGQELIGSQLLTNLHPNGPGKWRGRAYVPDLNRRASATVLRTRPDQLRVSGCALGGLICQTRHWQRIGN
jgi:uncharacterized protein (DUF2147 family)